MKGFRWLGLPAVAALALLVFALTAGIGSARTTVAPNNTAPPTISGKAQVGELLKADNGTWTGTAPITYTYQWRICDNNGGACHDIAGASGNEYTLKAADQGNTVRVQVTGKNADGSDTSTSVPTALIAAASASTPTPTPTPAGNGCPKLAAGASSVARDGRRLPGPPPDRPDPGEPGGHHPWHGRVHGPAPRLRHLR